MNYNLNNQKIQAKYFQKYDSMCKYMQRKNTMNKRMKWTNEEINFIKEHYPLKGAKFCAYNLNRSIGSVRHVAMRNNIEFSTWSEEEIDILKNTYPIYGLCECAVLLKRNGNTIINKIKQLNIPLNTYRFNKNENEFLLKNYSLLGIKKCSEILNIPECKLSAKVRKLKLILNKNVRCEICKNTRYVKSNDEYNIHPQQFFDIKTPEVAYILGLLWADGYVSNIRSGIIAIAALEDDLETVKHIFLSTGKWNLNKRQLPNRRPQMTIQTTNKPLTTFLANNDYIVKSIASADKILSKIPNELQHYWFRGLIDGDGCFI